MNNQQASDMFSINVSINSAKNVDALLDKVLDASLRHTGCDAAIYYQKEGMILRVKSIKTADPRKAPRAGSFELLDYSESILCARAIIEQRSVLISDIYGDFSEELSSELYEFDRITGDHTKSALLLPFNKLDGSGIGLLMLLNPRDKDHIPVGFREEDLLTIRSICLQASASLSSLISVKETQLMILSFVETMISAVGALTPYNANHTRNMVTYGFNFVLFLKGTPNELSDRSSKQLILSIWFHDIGKLCTPVSIMNKNTRLWPLQKSEILHRMEIFRLNAKLRLCTGVISPGEAGEIVSRTDEVVQFVEKADGSVVEDREEMLAKIHTWTFESDSGEQLPYLTDEEIHQLSVKYRTLTDEEFEIMHNHVVETGRLLSSMYFPSEMSDVKSWASSHHELLNGKGYPNHLTAEELPKEVRILTILDIFEALTATDREYKKPKTPEEAVTILHRMAEAGELDDELVTLFEESRCWE